MERINVILCLCRWVLTKIGEDARAIVGIQCGERALALRADLDEFFVCQEGEDFCEIEEHGNFEPEDMPPIVVGITDEEGGADSFPGGIDPEELRQALQDISDLSPQLEPDSFSSYTVMNRELIELLSQIIDFFLSLDEEQRVEQLVTAMRDHSLQSAVEHPDDELVWNSWGSLRSLCLDMQEQTVLTLHVMLELYLNSLVQYQNCRLRRRLTAFHRDLNDGWGCTCARVARCEEILEDAEDVMRDLVRLLAPDSDIGAVYTVNGRELSANDIATLLPAAHRRHRELALPICRCLKADNREGDDCGPNAV